MAKLNIVEKANKVMSFRKMIRAICQKNGLDYPSDEKIAEYISRGYGMDVDEFIEAYKGKHGIFTDPFEDFKKAILDKGLGTTPSDEELRSYVAENGYNVDGFLRHNIINQYEGVEKEILIKTLKLPIPRLVMLWNIFIEESGIYGEDSHIYDLQDQGELTFLYRHMSNDDYRRVCAISKSYRYLQWFSLNDGTIKGRSDKDVKDTIIGFWGEIFERIMLYPYAYEFDVEGYHSGASTYFDDVFFPIIAEMVGYKIDGCKGTIEKIKK